MKQVAVSTVFLVLVALAAADPPQIRRCTAVDETKCSVTALRITPPCIKNNCILKKGRNASLEFDFTPNFATSNLKTAVYWAEDVNQTPFGAVGIADACQFATCPTVAGTPNKLVYSLYIGKRLPTGSFWFRWKVWNDDNPAELCCFETRVQLRP